MDFLFILSSLQVWIKLSTEILPSLHFSKQIKPIEIKKFFLYNGLLNRHYYYYNYLYIYKILIVMGDGKWNLKFPRKNL